MILSVAAISMSVAGFVSGCGASSGAGDSALVSQENAMNNENLENDASQAAASEASSDASLDAAGEAAAEAAAPREPFVPEVIAVYEAEDAEFKGNVAAASDGSGFSGTGFANGFNKADEDSITFHLDVADTGFYDLVFTSKAAGYKENYVAVDGENMGTMVTDSSDYSDYTFRHVYFESGAHDVTVTAYWGYIDLDKVALTTTEPVDESFYNITAKLTNPNASDNAKRLYSFLLDEYGKHVLPGQYCDDGVFGKEFIAVEKATGKKPVVLGMDMMNYSPTNVAHGTSSKTVELAEAAWNAGYIVTLCWHWTTPEKYVTGEWYSSFRPEASSIDLEKIMNGTDQEGYDLLVSDMDAIAERLKPLAEADVPILWRPLHEAGGGWFWWGEKGAEPYLALYKLMYDKFVNEYHLDNLIWLWNGQKADWYPGDEYVDIIGEDIYPGNHVYTSQANRYYTAVNYTPNRKLVVLSENGCVPDPSLLKRDGAMWGFWCTWSGEFTAKNTAVYAYSDEYTEKDKIKEFYESEIVLTPEELPNLKEYPIREGL